MTPEQIAEGRRLKAAANEALEMGERVSVREGLKAVEAWAAERGIFLADREA